MMRMHDSVWQGCERLTQPCWFSFDVCLLLLLWL